MFSLSRLISLIVLTTGTSLAAHADSISFSYSVLANQNGGTSTTPLSVPGFDPATGTLNSLLIDLNFTGATSTTNNTLSLLAGARVIDSLGPFFVRSGSFDVPFLDSNSADLQAVTGSALIPYTIRFVTGGATTGTANGSITYNYTPLAATPEPSTLVLLGSGLLGVYGTLRRRRA